MSNNRSTVKRSASRFALLCGTVLLAVTEAAGQENLLPDFLEQEPAPAEAPETVPIAPPQPSSTVDDEEQEPEETEPVPDAEPEISANRDDLATDPNLADIGFAGPLTAARGGYGAEAFRGTNGELFAAWMQRIEAPVASRWAHIVLRRALLTRAPTPPRIRDGDWIAARADLLTRFGEADGAKMLLQNLPLDSYTPRLYGAAARAHLAAADIPALCLLAPTAQALSEDPLWNLADAICAGIEGDETTAVTYFNRLRRQEAVDPIDLLLAERITGLAGGVNRAANVDWEGDVSLNPLRFGLAAAGGVEIPEEIWQRSPAAHHGWAFRSSAVPLEQRLQSVWPAASAGIVSAREMGAIQSLHADRLDASDDVPRDIELLRTAYTGRTVAERVTAMEALVERGAAEGRRYASLLLVSPAASLIPPQDEFVEAAPLLIEAALATGRSDIALSWWPVLSRAEEPLQMRTWPLLVLADDAKAVPLSPGLVREAFRQLSEENEELARRQTRWLLAGLAGLGRIEGGQWESAFSDFGVGSKSDIYTEMLGRAARRGRKGEVAILGALGLQGTWAYVQPRDIRPVLSAYRDVGFEKEARMMAVEAYLRGM